MKICDLCQNATKTVETLQIPNKVHNIEEMDVCPTCKKTLKPNVISGYLKYYPYGYLMNQGNSSHIGVYDLENKYKEKCLKATAERNKSDCREITVINKTSIETLRREEIDKVTIECSLDTDYKETRMVGGHVNMEWGAGCRDGFADFYMSARVIAYLFPDEIYDEVSDMIRKELMVFKETSAQCLTFIESYGELKRWGNICDTDYYDRKHALDNKIKIIFDKTLKKIRGRKWGKVKKE